MSATKNTSKCPTCRATSQRAGNKVFPFCSERCQLVDLGRWLNEEYRVPDQADTSGGGSSDASIPARDDLEN